MTTQHLPDRQIMQTAFVTNDIERAVHAFGKKFNIGGWVQPEACTLSCYSFVAIA